MLTTTSWNPHPNLGTPGWADPADKDAVFYLPYRFLPSEGEQLAGVTPDNSQATGMLRQHQ